MKTYRTSEVAIIARIHPNTVRLYEEWGFISKPEREKNGYRIFNDLHVWQIRLARIAFSVEILQNGLRKKIIEAVKNVAKEDYDIAIKLVREYLEQLQKENENVEEAINITKHILSGTQEESFTSLRRKEVSEYLDISMDTLRNWEMNGLLTIKRKQNGYRVYINDDIKRLKIIRTLRCANYSLESILNMLNELGKNYDINIKMALNVPEHPEGIISACDRLIDSLLLAKENALKILDMIYEIKLRFDKPSIIPPTF